MAGKCLITEGYGTSNLLAFLLQGEKELIVRILSTPCSLPSFFSNLQSPESGFDFKKSHREVLATVFLVYFTPMNGQSSPGVVS